MSAFIISKETMDRAINGLERLNRDCRLPDTMRATIGADEDWSALGVALYNMNLEAVLSRYPSDNVETAPGPIDKSDIFENYRYVHKRDSAPFEWNYKALQCLSYQCCEGDVPNSPLYKELEVTIAQLAHKIISQSKAYEVAPWD